MNVILVICDALRYDHVTQKHMPNFTALMSGATSFSLCLSLGANTLSSLPYLLCSRNIGKTDDKQLELLESNFVNLLRSAGCTTAAIHSNILLTQRLSFREIFDFEVDLMSTKVGKNRMALRSLLRKINLWEKTRGLRTKAREESVAYRRAGNTLEACQAWIEEQEEPWFLWAHLMDTHIPYWPENYGDFVSFERLQELNEKILRNLHRNVELDAEEKRDIMQLYGEEVKYMDKWLAEFIERQSGDTLVIVTSDHGDEFGEYGAYSHSIKTHGQIPQLIHVPLVFFGPGIAGQVVDDYTCHLDVAPTILDYAGIEERIGYGNSLRPILEKRG